MSESPDWFWEAVDDKPSSDYIEVDAVDIHYLSWSKPGRKGLLFVHGHNAHAHWWDFIAPRYKAEFHTVAIDLSGMGDSDHRDEYSADRYALEIKAVADAADMSSDTILVAHSFGGLMALRAMASFPERFKALILLDSGVKHPDDETPREPERWNKPKVYPDLEIARSRFRLQPPQTCDNEYIVKHIARHSIEHIDDGFVWKFDEELNSRMQQSGDFAEDLASIKKPVSLMYGELSASFSSKSAQHMASIKNDLTVIELKDAQHHLFLDQPVSFMDKLDEILAGY